jgi:hypothetical protein
MVYNVILKLFVGHVNITANETILLIAAVLAIMANPEARQKKGTSIQSSSIFVCLLGNFTLRLRSGSRRSLSGVEAQTKLDEVLEALTQRRKDAKTLRKPETRAGKGKSIREKGKRDGKDEK